MSNTVSKAAAVKFENLVNQINSHLFAFNFHIDCSDISLDPNNTVLVRSIIRAYKAEGWDVSLNKRDNTLIFS